MVFIKMATVSMTLANSNSKGVYLVYSKVERKMLAQLKKCGYFN